LGAANLAWPQKQFLWSPEHQALTEISAATVRAALGDERYDEHWAAG
jgi:hypothetical protein